MVRVLTLSIALMLTPIASAQTSSDYIRTEEGKLIRAGDSKTLVLNELGFPDMQQGGTFYYRVDGDLYQIKFSGDTVRWIRRSRD